MVSRALLKVTAMAKLHPTCGGSSSRSSSGSGPKYKDIFRNYQSFPTFQNLPEDNDLNLTYYRQSSAGYYVHSHTWCFVGEITNDEVAQMDFLRNRVLVKDRRGQDDIPIAFYPESGSFDFKTLRNGHTICVMYAHKHQFLDLTIGLRIEELNTVKVIPCCLNDLLALSKYYAQSSDACWGCGKDDKGTGSGRGCHSLKKCGACKIARYCDRKCQTKDWTERHRVWCKAVPGFLELASKY